MQSSFWLCLGSFVTVGDVLFGEEQGAEQLFQPEACFLVQRQTHWDNKTPLLLETCSLRPPLTRAQEQCILY